MNLYSTTPKYNREIFHEIQLNRTKQYLLTTPDHVLGLHVLGDDLHYELLHYLSRNGGEADWPVVSCTLFPAPFED